MGLLRPAKLCDSCEEKKCSRRSGFGQTLFSPKVKTCSLELKKSTWKNIQTEAPTCEEKSRFNGAILAPVTVTVQRRFYKVKDYLDTNPVKYFKNVYL